MDPKRRHGPGSGAHASDSPDGTPTQSVVARGTGNAHAEDGGTANAGCQGPAPDAADRVAAHSAHASDTGNPIATAQNSIANSGTMTIVQAPRELVSRLWKRTLLVGTGLAVFVILASTTVADGPSSSPRASTATPTGDSGVSASPSDSGASASPTGSATTKPTDRSTTAPEPSADDSTPAPGLPAPSKTPDTSPPLAGPPQAGAILSADCTEETGPSHPAWPVQYGDGSWGQSEAVEEPELREDGSLLGGFKMVRANRPNLTYYWATGWTGVDRSDTEMDLVLNWTDGTTTPAAVGAWTEPATGTTLSLFRATSTASGSSTGHARPSMAVPPPAPNGGSDPVPFDRAGGRRCEGWLRPARRDFGPWPARSPSRDAL
jgi:hypothetical protein